MAQVTVYIPDELWDDYQAMRDGAKERGEPMYSTSSLFRRAVGDELKRLAARGGTTIPTSVRRHAVYELEER